MRMIGNGAMGSRRRYLAEQEVFMAETFGKAAGFTTPITKPVASFKAPTATGGVAKPKVAALKPTGAILPSASQRLTALKQGLVGQTAPGSSTPAAAASVGSVGKGDRLRRRGRFQRMATSSPVALLSREKIQAPNAAEPLDVFTKREPLKTSISEDDARHLVERHGLKGPLPKNLDREQKMAAYEARYVSAGGKKAEKWDHRAHTADKIKTGGLAVATAGGAGWLMTRGKLKGKGLSPRVRHHAETVAGAGATAGGAAELYAGHARRKRSSYASAPAGVAASALRRMRDYTA